MGVEGGGDDGVGDVDAAFRPLWALTLRVELNGSRRQRSIFQDFATTAVSLTIVPLWLLYIPLRAHFVIVVMSWGT